MPPNKAIQDFSEEIKANGDATGFKRKTPGLVKALFDQL